MHAGTWLQRQRLVLGSSPCCTCGEGPAAGGGAERRRGAGRPAVPGLRLRHHPAALFARARGCRGLGGPRCWARCCHAVSAGPLPPGPHPLPDSPSLLLSPSSVVRCPFPSLVHPVLTFRALLPFFSRASHPCRPGAWSLWYLCARPSSHHATSRGIYSWGDGLEPHRTGLVNTNRLFMVLMDVERLPTFRRDRPQPWPAAPHPRSRLAVLRPLPPSSSRCSPEGPPLRGPLPVSGSSFCFLFEPPVTRAFPLGDFGVLPPRRSAWLGALSSAF